MTILFSTSLLLLGSMFGILATSPSVHGQLTGTVCLVTPGTTTCPSSPASLSGTTGTQLRVSVFIQNSDGTNGFDVTLLADRTILKPAGADLTGTVLIAPQTVLVECLSGILVKGNVCSSTDTVNTLHFAAVGAPGMITGTPTTGLLFTAIYNITGTTSGIPLGFQTGCSNTSVSGGVCVTIANGTLTPDPETVQTATFSTGQAQDFGISASPPSQFITRGSSTTFTITVTGTNGFSGTVSLTATVAPLVKHGPTTSLPSMVGPNSSSTLTVSTVHNTPTGTYTVTVTGTSGSLSHTVTVTVTVIR
jgi:hypothetical protein